MHSYGNNFIPVISVNIKEHTQEHLFCYDATCDCHKDTEAIERIHQAYLDGEVTVQEATNIVLGRTI